MSSPRNRTGASFIVMVIIMALVMSTFAISVSQLSRSRSSTLISDATEKQVLYLAEDAANQMIYRLNTGTNTPISLTPAPEAGPLFKYEASYDGTNEPFGLGDGTVVGTAYLMSAADPNNTATAIYSKTVYYAVKSGGGGGVPITVYIKTSGTAQNIPFYRVWDTTNQVWGPELQASPCSSGIFNSTNVHLQFITLTFDPGSSKAMLIMEDDRGNIWAEQWDGISSWSTASLVYNGGDTTLRTFFSRSFSLSYETTQTGGVNRAILVYADKRNAVHIPYYSIWDGSAWSPGKALEGYNPLSGQPYYIESVSCPTNGSKNIGVIWQDSNREVFGEGWNGTSWSNMGYSSQWSTTVASSYGRDIAVAAEQTSGDIIFVYAEKSGQFELMSKIWNGTSLSTEAAIGATWKQTARWVTLASVPKTDQILLAYITSTPSYTLLTNTWNGANWGGTSTTLGTVYNNSSYNVQYYGIFCSGDAQATLMYSSSTNTLIRRDWQGGTTWASPITMTSGWTRSYGVVARSPLLSNILSAFYAEPANRNLVEYHTNSSLVWQASTNFFTGLTLNPPYERITIALPANSGGFEGVKGTWRENY